MYLRKHMFPSHRERGINGKTEIKNIIQIRVAQAWYSKFSNLHLHYISLDIVTDICTYVETKVSGLPSICCCFSKQIVLKLCKFSSKYWTLVIYSDKYKLAKLSGQIRLVNLQEETFRFPLSELALQERWNSKT